jgi:putative transcriptional regulator
MFRAVDGRRAAIAVPWLAALAVGAWISTEPPSTAGQAERPIVGQLLVATEEMKDPRFVESVIYLVKHDGEGTLGLVINRPIARGRIDELLKGFGAEAKGSNRDIVIHYGGPVSGRQGFMLHSDDVTLQSSIRAKDGIVMTSDTRMIEAVAGGKGPQQFIFAFGYAGWAPGQLQDELKANSWIVVGADKGLIFSEDAENKWRRAMDKRQIPL